jgi:hypothetical protein
VKVGELYEVTQWWNIHRSIQNYWKDCGPVLYLGEDIFKHKDGTKTISHAVLVLAKGERRILDKTFLEFLQPLFIPGVTNESR